jgi:hypothetical protein
MVFTRFAIQRAPQNSLATSLFRLSSSCSTSIQRMRPNTWNGPMCTWRRQASLRCKWEVWKYTVMHLRLAGNSILFFVCHKRYPFQENVLLLILKEIIYFVLFNYIFFSKFVSEVDTSTRKCSKHCTTDSTSPILRIRTRHRTAVYITPQKNTK